MGLLKHLLFWPYTGSKFLFDFSMQKVMGVVEEELTDDNAVKAELLELQLKLELGDITDDEYVEREAALMYRLREIREWREKLGMGVSGGPVRVAQDEGEGEVEGDKTAEASASSSSSSSSEDREPKVADPSDVSIELNFDDWHQ